MEVKRLANGEVAWCSAAAASGLGAVLVGGAGGTQEPGMLMNHAGTTGDRSEVGTKTHNPEPALPTLHSNPNKR